MSGMIIGTPDAIALRKRMEQLESQVQALCDGMNAMGKAISTLADTVDELDASLRDLKEPTSG